MTEKNIKDRRSFVEVSSESHFPIQNLPYGVFRRPGDRDRHIGVAIGDLVFDCSLAEREGLLPTQQSETHSSFQAQSLNRLMSLGKVECAEIRHSLIDLLDRDNPTLRDDSSLRERLFVPQSDAKLEMPVEIGDYTDFYSSLEHATNVGTMIRGKDNALQPNWRHLPVGYHGRASSVIVSGTDVVRPNGQTKPPDGEPVFGPCRLLDYELEMGFFVGTGNPLGTPIPVDRAVDHIFGMVLVNDWSARDIQKWEYVPLGPFLGKSFATSISPWVVPMDALQPFRVSPPPQDPPVLPYLQAEGDWGLDIDLEIHLRAAGSDEPARIAATNFRNMYFTIVQQLAHMTSNGTNIEPGDLYASGTVSGPTPDSYGSLLELTWRGTKPIALPGGQTRKFLQDGDEVILRGCCAAPGFRVGFGEVKGTILPALA